MSQVQVMTWVLFFSVLFAVMAFIFSYARMQAICVDYLVASVAIFIGMMALWTLQVVIFGW